MFATEIEGMERVEEWLSWLSGRGRTDQTVYTYRSVMRHVMTVLGEAGLSTDPESMGVREIYYIADEGGRESSRKLRVHVMGKFIEWATGHNPGDDAALMWNQEVADRTFISPDEFWRLWQMADERERVILALGAFMGLRRSEIVSIRVEDVRGDTLTIYGKGHGAGKRAVLPIPEMVKKTIREYLAVRPQTTVDRLIVDTRYGKPCCMSTQKLYDLIKELGAGTCVEVTPHALRRLFATTLRDRNVDLDDIRTLMRHERVETTLDCYIRPNSRRLEGIMTDFTI